MKTSFALPSHLEDKCLELEVLAHNIKVITHNKPRIKPKENEEPHKTEFREFVAGGTKDCLMWFSSYEELEKVTKRARRSYKKLKQEKEKGIKNIPRIIIQYFNYKSRIIDFENVYEKSIRFQREVVRYYQAINGSLS